ncbi:3-deoxy-D-manno-octulosonate 8-phosphate phosphatase [Proteus mirabilis]|uniref:3-deoxy-D-manno-octulosonate 8-phosphate phosphatase n=1 Tax=Proteus mirabilis TaxID=584 RepID=A0A379FJK4_PROMI|nr:3-deoxy-D-manno-octulosonate 8-phosphate phosphatase [Proteus mirabilis]
MALHIFTQGQHNKLLAYQQLLDTLNLKPEQTAYIGDDLIDLPVMEKVGLSVAVADAHPLLTPRADYVTHILGWTRCSTRIM